MQNRLKEETNPHVRRVDSLSEYLRPGIRRFNVPYLHELLSTDMLQYFMNSTVDPTLPRVGNIDTERTMVVANV